MTLKASTLARSTSPTTSNRRLGLFADMFGGRSPGPLDLQTAVMIPIVAAMLADGRVDEDELLQIEMLCTTSPLFFRNSSAENERLIVRATRMIEDRGAEKMCRQAAAALSPELRETAFVHAAKMVYLDSGQSEREAIEDLTSWLSIATVRARVLIDVVSVMQRSAP